MAAKLSDVAKTLASQLRAEIGVKGPRTKVAAGAFQRLAMIGLDSLSPFPYEVTAALYGVSDAVGTGRLSGRIVEKIKGLSDWQMCNLVAEIATNCAVSGEVSAFLIQRFSPPAPDHCPAEGVHEWMTFRCLRRGRHSAHVNEDERVRWEEGGTVTDMEGRPLLTGTVQPQSEEGYRRERADLYQKRAARWEPEP